MKEKLRNKKFVYTIIGVISFLLVTLALTYAYWVVTRSQENTNVLGTACLDINLEGTGDIKLQDEFPRKDSEYELLEPYTFTITNNCSQSVDYQVALEMIDVENYDELLSSSVKVALDDKISLLSSNPEVDFTITDAYEARQLAVGTLADKNDSVTYNLRIWIDSDAPNTEMNKAFRSKIAVTAGQGIEVAKQSLRNTILANYGGIDSITEIGYEKVQGPYMTLNLNMGTTAYYYGTDFTYNESENKYTLAGDLVNATVEECNNGKLADETEIKCGKYTLKSTTASYSKAAPLYEVTNWNVEGKENYISVNYIQYNYPFSFKQNGLFKTNDDLGTSYYFRGDIENNYVQFGNYQANSSLTYFDFTSWSEKEINFTEETPMYWRILRINGDGTIRLVYDGIEKATNDTAHISNIGWSNYNSETNDKKYVGYTYDTSDSDNTQIDSTIKTQLDAWYDTHLEKKYGGYIADAIFCNDRSGGEYVYVDEDGNTTTEDLASRVAYKYSSLYRNPNFPILTCANKNDRYTINKSTGNGYLTNPIGTITVDESTMAAEYIESGDYYWTMTPLAYRYDDYSELSMVWSGKYSTGTWEFGTPSGYAVGMEKYDDPITVRPVINLRADVKFEGDGSFETPYKIITE